MQLKNWKILIPSILLILFLATFALKNQEKPDQKTLPAHNEKQTAKAVSPPSMPENQETLFDGNLKKLNEKWTGDFNAMAARNIIRVLVPYSEPFYFLDGIDQRGLTYEMLKQFEQYLNNKLKRKTIQVRVIIIPTDRDKLIPNLAAGLGDIAAGNLTITPIRQEVVDFSNPGIKDVEEIIVTGPGISAINSVNDLAGKKIYVRKSSSYYESLLQLNARLKKEKKNQVQIKPVDELLEDEDILEMMNAGIIPATVMDSHKARCWIDIFENLIFHENIKLRENGRIAWAIRKNSPELKQIINEFVQSHKKGTLMGNILINRYLKTCKWVSNPMEKDAFKRFEESITFFKKYGKKYDIDWLMIAALAYQESRINQSKRNPSGAMGVMQVLPTTASDPNINISGIDTLEGNIHAGVKYLWFVRSRYFENETMEDLDKLFFTMASYNAGPAKIARLRKEASQMNLDPNVWFDNVEIVAAKRIGRETVQYVSNIYKYYIAYRLIVDAAREKEEIKKRLETG